MQSSAVSYPMMAAIKHTVLFLSNYLTKQSRARGAGAGRRHAAGSVSHREQKETSGEALSAVDGRNPMSGFRKLQTHDKR